MAFYDKSLCSFVFGLLVVIAAAVTITPAAHAQTTCPALPTDTGQVALSVSLPQGSYNIWVRMKVVDAANNSFWLQIDDLCGVSAGDTVTTADWTWISAATANLSAGTHTVKLIGKKPPVGIDKLLFLSGTQCIPSGLGENCTNSQMIITPTFNCLGPCPTLPPDINNLEATPTPTQSGSYGPNGFGVPQISPGEEFPGNGSNFNGHGNSSRQSFVQMLLLLFTVILTFILRLLGMG